MNFTQLEPQKENIQPLKSGRKAKDLSVALHADMDHELHHKLSEERQKFEMILRTYEGDDPLAPWHEYILWTEQNFPKCGKEGNVTDLLEKCIMKFKSTEIYKQDARFLKIWLKYACTNVSSSEFYHIMEGHGIGTELAEFYREWAHLFERKGDVKKADEVFRKGLQRNATPIETLQQAYRNFQYRLATRIKGTVEDLDEEQDATIERRPFGVLSTKEDDVKVGSVRIPKDNVSPLQGLKVHQVKSNKNNNNAAFQIFDENGVTNPSEGGLGNQLRGVPVSSIAERENTSKPSKWTSASLKCGPKRATKQTASFPVYEEEGAANENVRCMEVNSALKSRPAMELRKIQVDDFQCPVAVFEPPDPTRVARYCKEKVYGGRTEISFEELRAVKYKERHEKKLQEEKQKELELALKQAESEIRRLKEAMMQKDNSENMSRELVDSGRSYSAQESSQGSIPQQSYNEPEKKSTPINKAARGIGDPQSLWQPSPTVNTKEAMHMMNELWSSSYQEPSIIANEVVAKPPLAAFEIFESVCVPSNEQEAAAASVMPASRFQQPLRSREFQSAGVPMQTESEDQPGDLNGPNGKENFQPQDYVLPQERRKLSGILTPSTDIHFVPLTDEEKFSQQEDLGVTVINENEDVTLPPNYTAAFSIPIFASTPYQGYRPAPKGETSQMSSNLGENLAQRNLCNSKDVMPCKSSSVSTTSVCAGKSYGNMLYPIPEHSMEYYSSSSTSSSHSQGRQSTQKFLSANNHVGEQTERNACQKDGNNSFGRDLQQDIVQSLDSVSIAGEIDPFDETLISKQLSMLKHPLAKYDNYIVVDEHLPKVKGNMKINLGSEVFNLQKCIGEGAYAKVYITRCSKTLKVQRPSWSWEFYICMEVKNRLEEKQLMASFLEVDKMYVYNNASVLVSKYHEYGTLLDFINTREGSDWENLNLHFTMEMMLIFHHLHRCKIIHGDVKPDNFVIQLRPSVSNPKIGVTLQLIDFGRSIDMSLFPEGTTFKRVVKTSGFQCTEMRMNKDWTYQIDIYGMVATTYCLLFGSYMNLDFKNNRWVLKERLRRWWHVSLWQNFFTDLLNIESCNKIPNLMSHYSQFQDTLRRKKAVFSKDPNNIFKKKII